ncbi:hypothetical protein [Terrisporobacter glycolicus]|uniref:hypothetical protein n=1 Tax=Terrisporobacter glycolicus TaxID=36841 RepID=UPI003463E5D9
MIKNNVVKVKFIDELSKCLNIGQLDVAEAVDRSEIDIYEILEWKPRKRVDLDDIYRKDLVEFCLIIIEKYANENKEFKLWLQNNINIFCYEGNVAYINKSFFN